MAESITIEQYLRGKSAIPLSDETVAAILADAGVTADSPVSDLTRKQKDLMTADLFEWIATNPSVGGSVADANGVWSHKESGVTISTADRSTWLRMAHALRKKYGLAVGGNSSIKLQLRGIGYGKRTRFC